MLDPLIPSQDEVLTLVKHHGWKKSGFRFNEQIWIKYGAYVTLSEAAIQQHVYQNADPRILRVPKVYDAFAAPRPQDLPVTCIIMEYIEGDDYVDCYKKDSEAATENLVERYQA